MTRSKFDDEDEVTIPSFADYLIEQYPFWTPESVQAMADEASDVMSLATAAAHRKYGECERYLCVEGCCVVEWHPHLGNTGGMGPAGCPCDRLDDPRGEKIA